MVQACEPQAAEPRQADGGCSLGGTIRALTSRVGLRDSRKRVAVFSPPGVPIVARGPAGRIV